MQDCLNCQWMRLFGARCYCVLDGRIKNESHNCCCWQLKKEPRSRHSGARKQQTA